MSESNPVPKASGRDDGSLYRTWDRAAVAAISVGAAIRLVWGLAFHPAFNYVYSDAGGYVDRAQRLALGGPFERFDTLYPAGTHILLALPFRLFGTGRAGIWAGAVLWSLLSCLIPVLVWRVSRRLIGPRAAAVAAALAAFWPLFIAYGGFFMSEIPSIAALLGMILLGLRTTESSGRTRLALGMLTGILAGISVVMRPQLGLNVLIVAWLMLRKRDRARPLAAAAAAGLLIPLAGVVALNWAIAGKPTVSENAGVNFFHAHCPVQISWYGRVGHEVRLFGAPPSVQLDRGRDYFFADAYPTDQGLLFREAMRCVREDGIGHVAVVLRNVADMGLPTVPWPPSNERGLRRFVRPANAAYSVVLPTIVVASIVLVNRKRRQNLPRGEGIFLAHLAAMVPLGALFVGDPRYRMAYDAFGLALAAVLLLWAIDAIRRRAARGPSPPPEESPAGVPATVVEN